MKLYITGWNDGRFRLATAIDQVAMMAPTLWRWRMTRAVALPEGIVFGVELRKFVASLRATGNDVWSVDD